MRNKLIPAIVFIAIGAISTWASAHTGVENHVHGSWMAGFIHPFVGIDHLAAMLAVGMWSALSARRAGPGLLWGPLGFASMLLVGSLMGLQGLALQAVEPMIAASLLVIGLLVIGRLQVAGFVAALLVGAFAVFHGLAHGYELAAAPDAAGTVIGMLSATALLHTAGLGLGWLLRSAQVWVPRAAGAAVALVGSALFLQLA